MLKPISQKNISVVLSVDNACISYAAVTIQSVKNAANKNQSYNIYILYTKLDKHFRHHLENFSEENFSVCCLDIKPYLYKKDLSPTQIHRCCFFFLIPEIFENTDKVLYLTHNTLVQSDVAPLFDTDLQNHAVGACVSPIKKTYKEYLHQNLKIFDKNYINTAVLLFNISFFKNQKILKKCWEKLKDSKKYRFLEQDIFNMSIFSKYSSYSLFQEVACNLRNNLDIFSTILIKKFSKFPNIIFRSNKRRSNKIYTLFNTK